MKTNETTSQIYKLNEIPGFIDSKLNEPGVELKEFTEGNISFFVPEASSIYDAPAFFNPIMVLNRDISILFCKLYSKKVDHKIRVVEPLAGIGIRGMRLASELGDIIAEIVINDFDQITTQIANFNIRSKGLESQVKQFKREARSFLHNLSEKGFKFHYLDLDPFGSPAKFIDSIWSVLSLSAIVSITATDMTALCGVYPNSCLRKYGAIPLNNFHTHETASRILIASTVLSAARQGYGIKPIFTLSADHYAKVFFTTRKGRGEANQATSQIGFSFTCDDCMQIEYKSGLVNEPPSCCGKMVKAGPLWTGNLFDEEWCSNALFELEEETDINSIQKVKYDTSNRLLKILTEGKQAFCLKGYYAIDLISSKLKIKQPKFKIFKAEMEKRGYKVIQTRFRKQAFRTDAKMEVITKVFQEISETED